MDTVRWFILLGSVNAFLAIGAGAFGAHGLRQRLAPRMLEAFQTGAEYHLIHGVALIGIAILLQNWRSDLLIWAGFLIVAGMVLFSGSLYVMAMTGLRGLGAITPFGGIAFMLGWLLIAIWAVRYS